MNTEKELLKCNSIIEASDYLRYLNLNGTSRRHNLETFRKTRLSPSVRELVNLMVVMMARVALIGVIREIKRDK